MHRLLVALLAALDALLAAAVGIAVVLAPLALMWVVALGDADWSALWPSAAAVWHLGHFVPITVTLPDAYLAATGVDPSLATFTLSLAPLAFAAFTGLFAARSGIRAAESGAALTGWLSGTVVFAGLAALIALTSGAALVSFEAWQAILFPSLIFAVPSFLGAVVGAWRIGDEGPIDRVRARIERMPSDWAAVPTLVLRGAALTTLGLVAVGGVVVAAGLVARGTQIITLFQASNVDGIGATVLALGQLVYLPTLVAWAVAFAAGPGFALGTDTAVTPAATQVGAVPGIPILGIIPESTTPWLLLLALLPVAVGALTGWILRSAMPERADHEPVAPRLVVAVAVAAVTGGGGAVIAIFSSGAIGPGRLAETGPQPGPLALALGLEVLVGLAILLLAPRTPLPRRSPRDLHPVDREPEAVQAFRDRPSEALLPAAVSAPWTPEPESGRGGDENRTAPVDSDADVQARIRDAWARVEPMPAEWRTEGGTDATDGRGARPVD